jgi:hypothetical protein
MEQKIISHIELQLRIANLRAEKLMQEEELKRNFTAVIHGLYPSTLLKEAVNKVANDEDLQKDMAKAGIGIGTNFLIKHLLKKHNIKRVLSAALLEIISPLLINNAPKMISGIKQWLHLNGNESHFEQEESIED